MTHDDKKWPDFYKDRLLSKNYREYVADRYGIFLNEIFDRIKEGDRVVEVGCGLATITSILKDDTERPWCGFRAYDINPDMVQYARVNLNDGLPVEIGDARKPTGMYPDIVHSHGMLEHLSDDDIRSVIEAGRKDGARWGIHYVPGDKYITPSYGDERLMTLDQWNKICKPTGSFTFNEGYDHCLIWKY